MAAKQLERTIQEMDLLSQSFSDLIALRSAEENKQTVGMEIERERESESCGILVPLNAVSSQSMVKQLVIKWLRITAMMTNH